MNALSWLAFAGTAAHSPDIGGTPTRDLEEDLPHNPAMDPVYEAGVREIAAL